MAYNVGAWLMLGLAYETAEGGTSRRLAFGILGLSGTMISATIFVGTPNVSYFCGLSAILNALYAALTLRSWRRTRASLWLAMFGIGVAKIVWEISFGPIVSGNLAWPPHMGAHIAGLLAGVVVALSVAHRVAVLPPLTWRVQTINLLLSSRGRHVRQSALAFPACRCRRQVAGVDG